MAELLPPPAPQPGAEVNRLMSIFEANHGLTDPVARAAKVVEAQRILQRGPSASEKIGRVGLAIGFVQSGKTMSFTTLAALAADGGYRVVIVILGNTHLLVGQNRDRLADDLGIDQRDDWRWAHLHMPRASTDIDQLLAQDERVILITVLKHASRLRAIADMAERSAGAASVRCLMIDDEADQASLNAGVRKGKVTPTHAAIQQMRRAFPAHLYVQYTATPFAPLLLEPQDGLAPEFAEILTPGAAYTGGRTFFLDQRDVVVRAVPDDEAEEKAPNRLPEGLERALYSFLVSSALLRLAGKRSAVSMLIHTSGLKSDHLTIRRLVETALHAARTRLALSPQDVGRQAWLSRLQQARQDMAAHGGLEVDTDAFANSLRKVADFARVWMVNSAAEGENPDWALSPVNILIGGNKLDRGFTVRGLTTTYLTRRATGGQADTIEQRARCYGYKRDVLQYCRVFAPQNVIDAFTALVHTEADMRASLAAWQEAGRPLHEWSATEGLVLPDDIRPTRPTVLKDPYDRPFVGWSFLRRPTLDPDGVESNFELIESVGLLKQAEVQYGEVSVRLLPDVLVQDVVDEILKKWSGGGSPGWDLPTLSRGLTSLVSSRLVERMTLVYLERAGGQARRRTWREPDGFDQLMQGSNAGTGYPGDRGLLEGLQLQVHHLTPKDRDNATLALALHVPAFRGGLQVVSRRRGSASA